MTPPFHRNAAAAPAIRAQAAGAHAGRTYAQRMHAGRLRVTRRRMLGMSVLGVLFALLVLAGIGGWLGWNMSRVPDRPLVELAQRWAPPPSQFVAIDGLRVHLRDQGRRDDPVPIVLIHGTSASLHTWEGWVATLSRERRVITMDIPGFGLTGPRPDHDYSMPAYARFVGALLDALQVRRAVVGGNSLGGEIAWYFATVQPQRVERLILVDAAGYAFEPQDLPMAFRLSRAAAQWPALRPLVRESLPRRLVESSVRNVYGDPSRVDEALVDRYYDLATRAGNRDALTHRMEETLREVQDPAFSARIATLRVPTLVLWGGRDRLIPPAYAKRFAQDIPGAQLQVFERLGHVPQEEDPAATLVPVLAFLRR